MKLPNKILEKKLLSSGYDLVIGVDEVGVGCLAGPVMVCAVALGKKFFEKIHKKLHGIRDSKLLLPHQREKFAGELIKEKDLKYELAYCYPKTIDKINIYQATREAMRRAVKKISNYQFTISNEFSMPKFPTKTIVLVDGKTKIDGLNFDQQAIVKGDRKVFVIACASVIAKVFRDRMMVKYAKKFPGYGFEKHKGYGTAEHLASLTALGPCPIHRKSFAPVSKLV